MHNGLLATTIDPLAARVQGLPVRAIGLGVQYHHCSCSGEHGSSEWSLAGHSVAGHAGCNRLSW